MLPQSWRLSVAPMLNYTGRHNRYLLRLLAPKVLLYTEMVTTGALLRGQPARWLAYHPAEHPLALQLGGNDPRALAQCAQLAADAGYDEINLNVGCPSHRVREGAFGACLMLHPELVAECVAAMAAAVALPITVKTRLGVDHQDRYEILAQFVQTVAQAGCDRFIIHARKAWLQGLNPKQNRTIPPLRYEWVYQLQQDFPQLSIIINGGIHALEAVQSHLSQVRGVMLGRVIIDNPYFLAEAAAAILPTGAPLPARQAIVEAYLPYIAEELAQGQSLSTLCRPLLGLFQGQPHARHWRRCLSEQTHQTGVGIQTILEALQQVIMVC